MVSLALHLRRSKGPCTEIMKGIQSSSFFAPVLNGSPCPVRDDPDDQYAQSASDPQNDDLSPQKKVLKIHLNTQFTDQRLHFCPLSLKQL